MKHISEILKKEDTDLSIAMDKELSMLKDMRSEVKADLDYIESKIYSLTKAKQVLFGDRNSEFPKYDRNETWEKKIESILQMNQRKRLTVNEIKNQIQKLEDTGMEDRSLLSSISSTLSVKAKTTEIFDRIQEHGVWKYSLKDN